MQRRAPFPTSYIVIATGLLMLVSIINITDKELLAPVVDSVKLDLGLSDTQIGAVRSAVFLAALLGQLFWGPLSDRWVRKYIITIGAVLWSSFTWMTAFVSGFGGLLMARAAMSFAEGCFNPSAYALLSDTAPRRRQGLMLGLMGLTYPVGTATALVTAAIIGTSHWRQPFIIFGVIGIFLGLLVLAVIREPQRGASEEAVQDSGGEYTGRFSLVGVRNLLAIPTIWLAFGLDTAQSVVNWSFAFWTPTYLTRYHIAPNSEAAAIALLPAIVGFVIGAVLSGIVIDRLRRWTRLAPVYVSLFAMVSGCALAVVVFSIHQLALLMVMAFWLGVATYMAQPAVTVILFGVAPPEARATSIAGSNVMVNLAVAVVSLAIGAVSDAAGLRLAFGGSVLLAYGAGALVCLGLLRTYGRDSARRDATVKDKVVVAE